uniref:MYXO-CTERM sorting domain-containing protein n=1 Tax=Arthrobacter sp. TaxID=1667 RepID=UPI002811E9BD
NPTPITYSVTDTRGNTVEAQVTVTYVPVEVVDDGGSNPVTDDGGSNPVTDDADKTPAKGGQPLADTGAKIGGAVTLALALLGAGLVLVLRRRQA